MTIFSDPGVIDSLINPTVVDNRGQQEKGKGKGVMLDVLTHFWHEVYNTYTAGSTDKIPTIRHDMQKDQWQSIARVIIYGFTMFKYFPLKLSPVIISMSLFGEESLSRQFLLDSFRAYLTVDDRRVLDTCLGTPLNIFMLKFKN